jgi:hypothetical protein
METVGSGAERKSFGELLSRLSSDSAALLRDEMELAKQEMREKLRTFQTGLVSIVIGAIVLQIALTALSTSAIIKLADSVGPAASALIIGAGLFLTGGIIALTGFRKLKNTNLKPEKTVQTLKEGKEWLKEMA